MSTPALPGLFGALEPTLNHYGYLAVAGLVTLEDFGIPVPGETIVIAAALFAGAGRLNVVLVGVIATVAAIVGDNIGFAIGHFGGRRLALRWGKYVFLTAERLDKAESFFERHGGKIIVVARFIEGLRQANGIVAGISGMHWRKFLIFNALGAALWVGVWVTLGYFAGNHITAIYNQINRYSLYVLIALAVVVVAFIAWRLWRRRARRRERGAAAESSAAGHTAAPSPRETFEASETSEVSETSGTIADSEPSENLESPGAGGAPDAAETRMHGETVEADVNPEADIHGEAGVHGEALKAHVHRDTSQANGSSETAEADATRGAPGTVEPGVRAAGESDRPEA